MSEFLFCLFKLNFNSGGSSTTSSNHFVINRSWMYDVASDIWHQLPDMNKCRFHLQKFRFETHQFHYLFIYYYCYYNKKI